MEPIHTVLTDQSEQIKTFSENQRSSTPIILNRDDHAAFFGLINKSRLLNGWLTRTASELDPTIRTWHEVFRHYEIPVAAFDGLYKRAFDVRQSKLQQGKEPPAMDATLLVSQWTGEHGLKAELKRREVDHGRTLATNAESQCQLCFGSGYKTVEKDGYPGSVKCDHGNS